MFWTTEKIKENLEHYSKYGMKFIYEIEEKYSPDLGKAEFIKINADAFRNNEKINISGEDISIMCTSDTHIITFTAPVYKHTFSSGQQFILNNNLSSIEARATNSFQHTYIDGVLHVGFAINSRILNIGFDQHVFPNTFSYIMSGIEELGNTVKSVRSKLDSVCRSLGY